MGRAIPGGLVPARLTAHSSATRHFEYVFGTGGIDVYDIDRRNRYVGQIAFPALPVRGLVADPASATLFVAYGGSGGSAGTGSMLAYDLVSGKTLWQRDYRTGVDNIAITPNCRTIYMAAGESSGSRTWEIIAPSNGKVTGSIMAGSGPHETIVGLDGEYVYLGGVDTPYLEMASTATGRVVRKIGPLHGPGVRPFTINATQTLAFTTAWSFLGFQVSSIETGKVLYSVSIPGFRFDATAFGSIPDHGISLSPTDASSTLSTQRTGTSTSLTSVASPDLPPVTSPTSSSRIHRREPTAGFSTAATDATSTSDDRET